MSSILVFITMLFISLTAYSQTNSVPNEVGAATDGTISLSDQLLLKAQGLIDAGEKKTTEFIDYGLAKTAGPSYILLTGPSVTTITSVAENSLAQIDKMATEKRALNTEQLKNIDNILTYAEIKLYLTANLKNKSSDPSVEIVTHNKNVYRSLKARWLRISQEVQSDKMLRAYCVMATVDLLGAKNSEDFISQKSLVDAINDSILLYLKMNPK